MATVKTLTDFYIAQNKLAVEAAGQTASLKAAAQRQSQAIGAEAAMEARRLKQMEQLEKFRQKMESMREARHLSAQERLEVAKLEAEDVRNRMAAEVRLTEGERERELKKELERLKQQGAKERTEYSAAEAMKRAKLQAETRLKTAEGTPAEQRLKVAQTIEAEERARLLRQPSKEDLVAQLQALKEAKDKKAISGDIYKTQRNLIEDRLSQSGVDIASDPDVLDVILPTPQEREQEVMASSNQLSDSIRQTAVTKLQNEMDRLYTILQQAEIGEGLRWASPEARTKGISLIQKRIGTLEKELQDILDAI